LAGILAPIPRLPRKSAGAIQPQIQEQDLGEGAKSLMENGFPLPQIPKAGEFGGGGRGLNAGRKPLYL